MVDIDPVELAQRLFEESTDGFLIFDPVNQRVLDVNPALQRLTGYRKRELTARNVTHVVSADSDDEMKELLKACRTTSFFHSREGFHLHTKDNTLLDINVSVSRIQTEDRPLGLLVVRDVTSRKQAERLFAGQNRVLKELGLGRPLQSVLDVLVHAMEDHKHGMKCSIHLVDNDDRRYLRHGAAPSLPDAYNQFIDGLEIGPQMGSCGTAAYSKEQVIVEDTQSDPRWADFADLAAKHNLRACWSQPIISEGDVLGTFAMYYHEPRKPTPSEMNLINEFSDLARLAIVRHNEIRFRAITDEQILHTQKLESLGVLAGGIAHDFNNLLIGMMTNAELAGEMISAESPAKACIDMIEQSVQMAAELCKQLLAYAGKHTLSVGDIKITGIADEMTRLLSVSIPDGVQLRMDYHHHLPSIQADASQLRQIMLNLVTNASDAIEDSGVVRVKTGMSHSDDISQSPPFFGSIPDEGFCQYLEVTDDGAGMDKETMFRMFEPFYTTRASGRGLGLATVLGIVQGHNGAIQVRSQPGRGTTVRVYLPCESGIE